MLCARRLSCNGAWDSGRLSAHDPVGIPNSPASGTVARLTAVSLLPCQWLPPGKRCSDMTPPLRRPGKDSLATCLGAAARPERATGAGPICSRASCTCSLAVEFKNDVCTCPCVQITLASTNYRIITELVDARDTRGWIISRRIHVCASLRVFVVMASTACTTS